MCHLAWATGCPDIWSNIILDVPVKGLWMQLTFDLGGPEQNKKADPPRNKRELLSDCLQIETLALALGLEPACSQTGTYTIGSPCSQAFGL